MESFDFGDYPNHVGRHENLIEGKVLFGPMRPSYSPFDLYWDVDNRIYYSSEGGLILKLGQTLQDLMKVPVGLRWLCLVMLNDKF